MQNDLFDIKVTPKYIAMPTHTQVIASRAEIIAGESTSCPCCSTHLKIYNRQLHSTTARELINLYHKGGASQWVHFGKFFLANGGGDFSKTRFHGLTVMAENNTENKSSGFWMLTPKGLDFIKHNVNIPKYVALYQNKPVGFSDDTVDISDCLGKNFIYKELMSNE